MSFWSWIGLAGKKEINELQSNIFTLIEENRLLREDNKKLFELIVDEKDKCVVEMKKQLQYERDALMDSVQNINTEVSSLIEAMGCTCGDLEEIKTLQNTNCDEIVNRVTNSQQKLTDSIEKSEKVFKGICDEFQKISEEKKKDIVENIQTARSMCLTSMESLLAETRKNDADLLAPLGKIKEQNEELMHYIYSNKEVLSENTNRLMSIVEQVGNIDKHTGSLEEIQSNLAALAESVQYLWTIMKLVWVDSVLSDIDGLN